MKPRLVTLLFTTVLLVLLPQPCRAACTVTGDPSNSWTNNIFRLDFNGVEDTAVLSEWQTTGSCLNVQYTLEGTMPASLNGVNVYFVGDGTPSLRISVD